MPNKVDEDKDFKNFKDYEGIANDDDAFILSDILPDEDLSEEGRTVIEKSLFQQIQDLSVSDKIHLARFGAKEVRTILIRDSNRLVQLAVISSQKITDSEILAIANNRQVNEDVLRVIAKNKEWMKTYLIKLALVNNPKTPLSIALKLVAYLQRKDIAFLAKSKNVSRAIAQVAARKISGEKY